MSRGRKIRCRGPRARPSSIAMPSCSASGRRSGGSRGRVRLNRACPGNTRTRQDREENVRNPPNRAVDVEPPVAVRVEDGPPLRMSMLVSDVSLVPPLIALVRCPQGAVRHPNQRLLDRPHVPRRESPVHPERTQVEDSISFDATREIHEWVNVREDEIPDRAEDWFASVEPRIPRPCHGAILRAAAEQQDDVVEVVLGFHVGEDRRISVLLEDRRGAQRTFEAMDLVRPDDAAKRVKGLSMLFVIVMQRLEPPLHLFGRTGGIDDGSFSRCEGRARRGGAPAAVEGPPPPCRFRARFVPGPPGPGSRPLPRGESVGGPPVLPVADGERPNRDGGGG